MSGMHDVRTQHIKPEDESVWIDPAGVPHKVTSSTASWVESNTNGVHESTKMGEWFVMMTPFDEWIKRKEKSAKVPKGLSK